MSFAKSFRTWVEIARWPFVMGKVNLELSVVWLGSGAKRGRRYAPKERRPRSRRRGKVCDKCKKLSGKRYSRK